MSPNGILGLYPREFEVIRDILVKSLTRFVFGLIVLASLNHTRDATVHLHLDHPLPESNSRQ